MYGVHRQRVGELFHRSAFVVRRSSFAIRRSSTSSLLSLWQQLTTTTNERSNEWTEERANGRRTDGRTGGRQTERMALAMNGNWYCQIQQLGKRTMSKRTNKQRTNRESDKQRRTAKTATASADLLGLFLEQGNTSKERVVSF